MTWVGPNADPMSKARSAGHSINLKEFFQDYCGIGAEFRPEDREKVTDMDAIAKIQGGGGETDAAATEFQQYAVKPVRP